MAVPGISVKRRRGFRRALRGIKSGSPPSRELAFGLADCQPVLDVRVLRGIAVMLFPDKKLN